MTDRPSTDDILKGWSVPRVAGLPHSALARRREEDDWLRRQHELAEVDPAARTVLIGRRMWDRELTAMLCTIWNGLGSGMRAIGDRMFGNDLRRLMTPLLMTLALIFLGAFLMGLTL